MASPHPSSFTSPAHHSPTDFALLSHPYPHHLMLPDDALLVASPAALRSSLYRNALPRPWPADSPGNDSLCPTPDPDNSFGVQRTMGVFGQSYLCSFQSSSNAGHIFTNDRPAHFPPLINSPPSSNGICTLSNMQGKLFDPQMHGGADVAMALRGSNAASRPCSASNKAEHLQPIQHQIEPLASATASRTNSLNEESVVIDQTGSHASSPNGFANNYPFDPGFAEQARRSSAFTSLENYPTLINAVAMDDLRKACETPCVSQSVVETSDTYLLATALATPSRWLPSPIPDSVARRAGSFAMASADARKVAHNPKLEALSSEDSFPNGAQIDKINDCNKLEAPFNAPLYASGMPQTRHRLHEIDHRRAFVDETRPIVRSTEVFNAAPKDFTGMKKRRLEMEASVGKDVGLGNLGESKISDPLMESSAKRQISTSQAKGKEKSRAKQKRGGRDSSMDTNPREENSRKSAEESRQEFVYVRARCGLATDSHSLAERVRREKINKRMRFLQDLVPGCGKITGKLKLLDEIINYVQSLQHQVEFLCMKLAAKSSTVSDLCEFEKPCMGEDKLLSKFYGAQVGAMSGRLWRGGDLQLL